MADIDVTTTRYARVMRGATAGCSIALAIASAGCTDPTVLEREARPSASATGIARQLPSGAGALRVDPDHSRPPLPTSDDRGCTDPIPSIDLRRPLSKEIGVADPQPGSFATSQGFFFVQQPERVPEPGTATIPGLALVIERGARTEPGRFFSLRARWENRVDKTRVVMRPAEGSIEDWRAPSWHVMARDRTTKRVYRFDPRVHRTCGNVSRISPDHYVTLESGARVPAGMEWTIFEWELPQDGFDVWITYRFCGHTEPGLGLGAIVPDDDVLREDVTRGMVASNTLSVGSE